MTLDKSSIACRSTYGRLLIFYNNTKPSGKYHFHIYVVCDADNYAALRFCVHTKDGSDFADGGVETRTASTEVQFLDEEANNENNHNHTDKEENGSTIQNLVLDMMKPFFMLGKVVNCDNYYTSSETFIKLQKKGVFARGTCHPSQKMFPLCVQYTRSEAKHSGCGSMKVATNKDHQLVAMGWVDGNPVNFLMTADGTSTKHVCRCVQSPSLQFQVPQAIPRYNHGMQGVDRFDQYIALFSMARRHCFKKFYNKLTMGLIDFALVNAEIHYYMVNLHAKTVDNHRYTFCDTLVDSLHTTDWGSFKADEVLVTPSEESMEETVTPPTVAKR